MSALADRARTLRELHVPGDPVVLPNAWDPPSARRLAQTGVAALATSSVAVAESLGYEDGGFTPAAEMLAAVGRIAAAVELPVTADLENGYGLSAEELVAGMLEAGVVGLNLEDTDHSTRTLADPDSHAEWLASVKEVGRAAGVDVVLNARVDVFLRADADADPDEVVEDGLRRSRRYAEAGADCVYPIMAPGREAIRRLVEGAGAPVNIVAGPAGLGRSDLAELGVARVSFGGGLAHAANDAAAAQVEDFLGR